jgi:uncharacterized protein
VRPRSYDTGVARLTPSLPALVGIGVAGGFFGALFGVGGGIVVVPLLLVVGLGPRQATATSLAVIGFAAVFGVAAFSALGEIDWGNAAVVGLPGMVGTLAGTWAQQRISSRLLVLLFAGLLLGVAAKLFVG